VCIQSVTFVWPRFARLPDLCITMSAEWGTIIKSGSTLIVPIHGQKSVLAVFHE
ncbi:Unknown protein sequence, partial [Pseudomonas syringae pv. ribicola]